MKPSVKWSDLDLAFAFVSSSEDTAEAFLQKSTGRIFVRSEVADVDELEEAGLEGDGWDGDDMVGIPGRHELDLGRPLVFRFVRSRLPDEYDRVRQVFSRRGAYERFKSILVERQLLKAWHEFQAEAEKEALLAWCEEHGIEIQT